jgi:lipopolysaccharide/colanic/teichoic acid biosynthesis glycosyltransferase
MTDLTEYEAVNFGISPVIGLEAPTAGIDQLLVRAVKRSMDIVIALALLLFLLPLLITLAVLIRLDSRGPCFFRCDRVGFRGRPLRMLKFRKMRGDASGRPLTTASDERFTRIGHLLAKYKFDELPQLWHVLVGEMSIVGPRPETREFVERHAAAYDGTILRVRPGIVGLSQIAFANESAILEPSDPVRHYLERILPQKIELDSLYARQLSIREDLAILFWGAVTVLLRRPVAVNRQTGSMNLRRRRPVDRTHHATPAPGGHV